MDSNYYNSCNKVLKLGEEESKSTKNDNINPKYKIINDWAYGIFKEVVGDSNIEDTNQILNKFAKELLSSVAEECLDRYREEKR